MDIERAKEILTILADGVNPITGEVLEKDDCCNQVEIVRALNIVLRQVENKSKGETRQNGKSKALFENAGKPWSEEDEEALSRMFEDGCSGKEICDHFKRSNRAIAARLVKLGKISEREEFMWTDTES